MKKEQIINIFKKYSHFIIAIIYIIFLFYFYYESTWDESYQIEAAFRLLHKMKYESSWLIQSDLSIPSFHYLTAWPIGYSFTLYLFLFAGFNINFAIIFIKSILILYNIHIWGKISTLFFKNNLNKLVFNFLFTLILVVDSRSTTELILMSSFGYISFYYLLQEKFGENKLDFLIIGLILSISLIYKYTSVTIIFSIFIFLLYKFKFTKSRLIDYLIICIPIILVVSTIFYLNYVKSSNISTLTNFNEYNKSTFIKNLNLTQIFSQVFINSLQIPVLLKKGFLHYFHIKISIYFIYIYIIIFFLSLVYFRIKNFSFFILIISSTIFLLFLISLIFFTNTNEWYPLIEYRYYQPISPLILILNIHVLGNIITYIRINKLIYVFFIIIIVIILFVFYSNKRFKNSELIKHNTNLVERFIITNNNKYSTNNFITFTDNNYFYLLPRNGISNVLYFNQLENYTLNNLENDVMIYIVTSKFSFTSLKPTLRDHDFNNIEVFSINNKFNVNFTSPYAIIYWKFYKRKSSN